MVVSLFRMYPSVYRLSNCIQKAGYGSSVLDDLINVYKSGKEVAERVTHIFRRERFFK